MNRYFLILLLTMILQSCPHLIAQSRTRINDIVPDRVFRVIDQTKGLNGNSSKNVFLILDFWATWCGVCIEGMEKVYGIQQAFPKDLRIVYITPQDEKTVTDFFMKHPSLKRFRLPFVYSDKIIGQVFPAQTIPHVIWVGKDRRLKAVTEGKYLQPTEVKSMIENNQVQLPLKEDEMRITHDRSMDEQSAAGYYQQTRSVFYRAMPGKASQSGFNPFDKNKLRFYATNATAKSIYNFVLGKMWRSHFRETSKRMILQVPPSFFDSVYGYEYEVWHSRDLQYFYRSILADQNNYIGLEMRIEKRSMPVYKLVIENRAKLPISKSGEEINQLINDFSEPRILRGGSVRDIVAALDYWLELIVVDETGVNDKLDLQLPDNILDKDALFARLREFGFNITRGEQELEVAVINNAPRK